jgi:two-component system response regulator YesN
MQNDGLDASWLQKYYHGFLQMVYHILQEKGLQALQIFSDPKSVEMASLATRSIKELQEWCIYTIERACEQIYKIEASQTVVEKIKIFINAHLESDLTREEIANHFYLNSDYLTRIFKKETGVTVIHYLHQQRIKRAEILITTTNKSISDIAALLRYSSLSHFSVMFKKYTNQNPMEFRKQNIKL